MKNTETLEYLKYTLVQRIGMMEAYSEDKETLVDDINQIYLNSKNKEELSKFFNLIFGISINYFNLFVITKDVAESDFREKRKRLFGDSEKPIIYPDPRTNSELAQEAAERELFETSTAPKKCTCGWCKIWGTHTEEKELTETMNKNMIGSGNYLKKLYDAAVPKLIDKNPIGIQPEYFGNPPLEIKASDRIGISAVVNHNKEAIESHEIENDNKHVSYHLVLPKSRRIGVGFDIESLIKLHENNKESIRISRILPRQNDNAVLIARLKVLNNKKHTLLQLPKSQRAELQETIDSINRIKSWMK